MPAQMPLQPLHPRQFAAMSRNVENIVGRRSDQQDANGRLWYPEAADFSEKVGRMARIHSGGSLTEGESEMPDVVRGAGIVSALSPQNPWDNNRRGALQLAQFGKANATLKPSVAKARLIREGVHPNDVLNPAVVGDPKKPHEGPHKTWNFFQNMADPDKVGPVTVDSHAARAVLGYSSGRGAQELPGNELRDDRRYNQYADIYRHVANRMGEKPHDVQAMAWLVQTNRQRYDE